MRRTIEETNPKAAAIAIDAATDPFVSIRRAAKAAGLPQSTTTQLIKRMETRYRPLNDELKTFKTKELLGMLEDRLYRALHYLDDTVLSGSSARDLAVIGGVLFDKIQLLKGAPTSIQSFAEMRQQGDVMTAIVHEMKVRGLMKVVDGQIVSSLDEPREQELIPAPAPAVTSGVN